MIREKAQCFEAIDQFDERSWTFLSQNKDIGEGKNAQFSKSSLHTSYPVLVNLHKKRMPSLERVPYTTYMFCFDT